MPRRSPSVSFTMPKPPKPDEPMDIETEFLTRKPEEGTNIMPLGLTREQRIAWQRRGVYRRPGFGVNPQTGEQEWSRGGWFNPARIAGKVPQSAGEVGPGYGELPEAPYVPLAERPEFIAMQQRQDEMGQIGRIMSEARRLDFEFRKSMGNPSEPGSGSAGGGLGFGPSTGSSIRRTGGGTWNQRTKGQLLGGGDELLAQYGLTSEGRVAEFPTQLAGQIRGGQLGATPRAARAQAPAPAPPPSAEQQAQDWGEVNTAVEAEITPEGGRSLIAPPINMFGGGAHLDTGLYMGGRTEANKDQYDAYKQQTRRTAELIDGRLARRGDIPRTMEELQEFVNSLNVDDRVGEFTEQYVTRRVKQANPDLYAEIVGEQRVGAENQKALDQYAANNPDATVQDFLNDPDAPKYQYDPIAKTMVRLPPTSEQIRLHKERQLQRQADASVDTLHPLMTVRDTSGNTELRYVEEEQAKREAARQAQDDRRYAAATANIARATALEAQGGMTQEALREVERRSNAIMTEIDKRTLESYLPVLTPEQAEKAAPGTEYKTTTGLLKKVPVAPVATPALEPAPATQPVAPVIPTATERRRAELEAQAPAPSNNDLLKFADRKITTGTFKAADLLYTLEAKAIIGAVDVLKSVISAPLKIAELEAKLGSDALAAMLTALEGAYKEDWIQEQLAAEGQQAGGNK